MPPTSEVAKKLAENAEGEIKNPLVGVPHDELLQRVSSFQQEKGLPEDILPLLQKGALVAQNPAGFEELKELDEADKTALRNEVTHRWRHPKALYFTIVLNSIAAAIQGWDQVSVHDGDHWIRCANIHHRLAPMELTWAFPRPWASPISAPNAAPIRLKAHAPETPGSLVLSMLCPILQFVFCKSTT